MHLDLKPNEVVIKAGDTNHLLNDQVVHGKLILTNQRIYFVRKNGNGSGLDHEVEHNDIHEVLIFNTKRIFPNGLSIVTKEGEELKFVVKKRNDWCEIINKMY